MRRLLKRWYAAHGRALPWRQTQDPYAIWISEIMLQQTQVATVIDYYQRFLARFPDVDHLAAAHEQEVLALWAGLGYYRRARQLHAAAKVIVGEFDAQFPTRFEDVVRLPGIGRYTAGAVTSFAYDARAPILEANTIRLFSRMLGLREDPTIHASQQKLWAFAESLLPRRRGSGGVNQALMELGSLVCKPVQPHCHACPLVEHCEAHRLGAQQQIPYVKKKVSAEQRLHALFVVRRGNKFLLRQNEPGGWWEGLWDFPRADATAILQPSLHKSSPKEQCDAPGVRADLSALFQRQFGLACRCTEHSRIIKHAVTRYKITLHCYTARLLPGATPVSQLSGGWMWVALDHCRAPLTSTAERLRRWLGSREATPGTKTRNS